MRNLVVKGDSYPTITVLRSGAIGDCILSTPALAALRQRFPHSRITLVGDPLSASLFEHSPDVDRLVTLDRKGKSFTAYIIELLRLRRERPDLLIDMHGGARSAVQAALIGGKRRVGWRGRRTRNFVYTDHAMDRPNLHFVERQLSILKPLGIFTQKEAAHLRLFLTSDEHIQAGRILAAAGHPSGRPYVILQATAGEHKRGLKQWAPDRYAALADRIQRETGLAVALTGHGEDERPVIDAILSAAALPLLNVFGKTSLRELAALIQHAAMYVGCDTGPMHLAAAVGTPIVALFGPTDPVRWRPWSEGPYRVLQLNLPCSPCPGITCAHDHQCMELLGVEPVIEAVLEMMRMSPMVTAVT